MEKVKKQFKRLRRGNYCYIFYALGGILILFLGWLGARSGLIIGQELTVFRFFNNSSWFITNFALFIAFAGTVWFAMGLSIFMLFWRRYAFAFEIFLASILASVTAAFLKGFGIRLRPYELLNGVHLAGTKYSDMGFPSIHTAVITAVAIVVSTRLGSGFRIAAWAIVILVACSRLILGMHAPFDVLGGLGVGIIIGSLINYFAGVPKPQLSSLNSVRLKNKKRRLAEQKNENYDK